MKKQVDAFHWIIGILRKNKIAFHITGGLAARVHGSTRPLADIDIEIENKDMKVIFEEAKRYVVYGPRRYVDKNFDLDLMTLNYHGQLIDISGILGQRLFSKKEKRWKDHPVDLSRSNKRVIGKVVPVVSLQKLVQYKSIIARKVDLEDIRQIV